jgi:MFS family permease
VAIVDFERPSGYFADALGRKNTLIIGTSLGFLGFLVYSLSFSFWGFLIAEVVLGMGQSLISGADSAMLYDTLLQYNRQNDYMKHEGRMVSVGNFAEALAGIAGGMLATISLRYPYYAQTIIALIGVPAALTLIEPKVYSTAIKMPFSKILRVVKYALSDNKQLRWNIIYSSVVGASTLTMAWFVQPWLIRADVSVYAIGIIWTALNLSVGIAALFAYRLERFFGINGTILGFTIALAIGFFGAALFENLWGLLFLFVFFIARGVATPVLKDYINRITESEFRATILSVRNFVIRIIFALWAPFYGWYIDKFSLMGALTVAGIVFVILTGICYSRTYGDSLSYRAYR